MIDVRVELKAGRRDAMKDNFFWEEQAIDLKGCLI